MKIMRAEIRENQEAMTYFLLESLELRKSKDSRDYLALTLSDRTGRIKGYVWNGAVAAATTLKAGSFVKVKAMAATMNGNLGLRVLQIREAQEGEVETEDLIEVVPGGIEPLKSKLIEVAASIGDEDCRRLIDAFLRDGSFMERFLACPGGVSVHHSYLGGLLEHTVSAMTLAATMAEKYPEVDRDLLLTGAFLHDIGKTMELSWERQKEYTTKGKLLGHILIGLLMLEEKMAGLENFPEELGMALKHMLISHHGEPDYGSPVRPAIPEAVALHLIDNTDAKLNHMGCHLRNSNQEALWSGMDRILGTAICRTRFTWRRDATADLAA